MLKVLSSSQIVTSMLDIEDLTSLDIFSNHSELTHLSGNDDARVFYGLEKMTRRFKCRA
jgi:hypothetical protein